MRDNDRSLMETPAMREVMRLISLNRKLTARERAVLVVRSWRADAPLDDGVRGLMPRIQETPFRHYLLMAVATVNLVPYAALLHADSRIAFLTSCIQADQPSSDPDRDVVRPFCAVWARLLAWEQFCSELVAEFGDPVVIEPRLRQELEHIRLLLTDWQALIKAACPRLRLPKADPEQLESLQEMLAACVHKWD